MSKYSLIANLPVYSQVVEIKIVSKWGRGLWEKCLFSECFAKIVPDTTRVKTNIASI